MRSRAADAGGPGEYLHRFSGSLDPPFGRWTPFLSLGKVFLAGRCLKEDEFPDPGEEIKGFQVITGKLAGQNPGALYGGKMEVDHDQISA